jgi:thioredoxin 2
MTETTKTQKIVARCPMCGTLNRVDLERVADRPKCAHCAKPILLDRPMAATDADFEKIVAGADVPVLVDFHADWCGPCKMMAPVLDELARGRMGRALVVKVDTDRNQETAMRYGIRGIPAFVVFRGGKEAGRQVGAVPRPALERLLDDAAAP